MLKYFEVSEVVSRLLTAETMPLYFETVSFFFLSLRTPSTIAPDHWKSQPRIGGRFARASPLPPPISSESSRATSRVASRSPSPSADQHPDVDTTSLIDDLSFTLDQFHLDIMADSDASSSAPPVATLSPEMVALIAATVTAALRPQIQPPAAAPPAPPIEPPFTGSNATTEFGGKSLPALFPSIESKIILDILSHTFTPLDLPRLLSPLAARQDYVAPPSSAPATEHSLALKHFPSFHSLLRPLLKYFEVLAAFAASSEKQWEVFAIRRSLADYVDRSRHMSCHENAENRRFHGWTNPVLINISHLTELHQQYKWSAVVIYHVEFHSARLWDMKAGNYSGWARPDHGLLSRLVYSHPLPPPLASGTPSSKPTSAKSKKGSTPVEQQICYDWNTGICKSSPCPAKRRHVCRTCEGDHQSSTCPKKT
ncbi:hypothetical protein DFH08DRAFT_953441 [Mycena albidolilacea]|uniref:Uncharacterized protein n=1 Tax=Mycena albidolilacea TaxID=1033008 RepID=A0AAD7AGN4_9AGAR|nr:hypothetical protein DFH08DRAFT_953441 [Mycena albidolilacea]